jgi:hypothetical protein
MVAFIDLMQNVLYAHKFQVRPFIGGSNLWLGKDLPVPEEPLSLIACQRQPSHESEFENATQIGANH